MAQLFQLRELPKYESLHDVAERFPQITIDAFQMWLVLLKTSSDLLQAYEAHTAQYKLSPGRFTVLLMVYRFPEESLTPSMLADRIGCTRATMTGLLDGLESAGLIIREAQDDDRRTFVIRMTPQGRQYVDNLLPSHFEQVAALVNTIEPREIKNLVKTLNKLRQALPVICNGARQRE